jgi:hypothetical protein
VVNEIAEIFSEGCDFARSGDTGELALGQCGEVFSDVRSLDLGRGDDNDVILVQPGDELVDVGLVGSAGCDLRFFPARALRKSASACSRVGCWCISCWPCHRVDFIPFYATAYIHRVYALLVKSSKISISKI